MIIIPHRVSGRIRLRAWRPDTSSIRTLTPWFNNLILNVGLDEIASTNTWLDCCHVGRSSDEIDPTQVTLIDPIVATSSRISANNNTANISPYAGLSRISYQFPVGAIDDVIREIGFGSSTSLGSNLFNRALIKDQFGDDNETYVLSDESLIIDYEFKVSVSENDITGFMLSDGVPVAFTARPAFANQTNYWCPYRVANYATSGQAAQSIFNTTVGSHIQAFDGGIGSILASPIGTSVNASGISNVGYVSGSCQRTAVAEWGPDLANFPSGIKSFFWTFNTPNGSGGNSFGAYQVELASPILKQVGETFLMNLGIAWGRDES